MQYGLVHPGSSRSRLVTLTCGGVGLQVCARASCRRRGFSDDGVACLSGEERLFFAGMRSAIAARTAAGAAIDVTRAVLRGEALNGFSSADRRGITPRGAR